MAKPAKGTADGPEGKGKKAKNALDASTPDLFGDLPQTDIPVDFGEVSPVAIHSIIQRVCRLGGYLAFSAPTGGNAVKIVISVGGSQGQRWNHDGHELAANLLHIHKLLDKLLADG